MVKLAVISIFRDNEGFHIAKYGERVRAIEGFDLRFYCIEGDSKDRSIDDLKALHEIDDRFVIMKHDTGIPAYGSVVHKARFECLRQVYNVGFDRIAEEGWADYILYMESDLRFAKDLPLRLMGLGKMPGIVAPLIVAGGAFYDIWGFRRFAKNGRGFENFTPHLSHITETEPFPIWGAGSALLFPAQAIYDGCRFDENVVVGMTRQIQEKMGWTLWCDPTTVVFHPVPNNNNEYNSHVYLFRKHLPKATVP